MSDDRRRATRHRVWFPMRVEPKAGGETLAMSQNISRTGLLMATAEDLEIGASVDVTLRLPTQDAQDHQVSGRVVRVERNDRDPEGLWPHLVAVEFRSEVPELEPLLQEVGGDPQS
ncbi:MAG: PilZ domain-containing protein [Myxococcota bacterium]